MKLESSAFAEDGRIPKRHTADGPDLSPPLSWSGIPAGTKSLVLIVHDPDAPRGDWVHWVLLDLPPQVTGLSEGVPDSPEPPSGGRHGTNDFRRLGWGGPAPPSGTHRYVFLLYALDAPTGLSVGATRAQALAAMKGHVLSEASLTGLYSRTA
jgi:Raf kinase inhibitor-like YbhB/YbcL family protein